MNLYDVNIFLLVLNLLYKEFDVWHKEAYIPYPPPPVVGKCEN